MEQVKYDIFISYKRQSLPTANNLYYRLTTRGYSTFFDLEEMRRDNFNVQLLNYIENAKDVFVILEEGSLDACKKDDWENDWFCHEIAFALEKKKNIIPILLGDYKMPNEDFFPDKLKELSLKHSPDFSFSFFDAYLDKLIEKKFITSEAHDQNKATSVFKFYSNENCQVFKEGKLVCSLEGMSDEPYYLPVPRKGDYRFKAQNDLTGRLRKIDETIDANEEKTLEIIWTHSLKIKIKEILKKIRTRYGKTIGVMISIAILLMLISWLINVQQKRILSVKDTQCSDTAQYMCEKTKDSICIPIDLGLPSGTLWGDKNVGAKTKYDNGCLYAWGETFQKGEYIEINYDVKSIAISSIKSTKLDVANVSLGDDWCIPSEQQFKEIMDSCTWIWTENDTMNGYRVIGPNNNELFLPANGCADGYLSKVNEYGYYWTSEISKKRANKQGGGLAKEMWFNKSRREIGEGLRYRGQGVRAVKR